MSDAEKIAAFDVIALAFTNQWHHRKWTWWCRSPSGGESKFDTREEAIADLVAWSRRAAKAHRWLPPMPRIQLAMVEA